MAEATTVAILLQAKDNASDALNKVKQNAQGLSDSFGRHRVKIGMAAAGIGAAITGIGVMSVKSSLDQQLGINQLDVALKNIGTSYEANKKQIEDLASAQQAKTNFGDEEQRKALQKLVQVTGDYDLSMQAMIPLMDMSAATGMKLEGAAVLVARAVSGEATALKRYGIELDASTEPQEVLNALMEKFAGQAEAAADPMTQLKNRVGDLFQVFGDLLLPVIEKLLPKIESFVRGVIDWADAHPELVKWLGLAGAALGVVLGVAGPLLLLLPGLIAAFGLLSIAMGPIGLLIIGIGAAIAGGIIVWQKWEEIIDFLKRDLADFAKKFIDMAIQISKAGSFLLGWMPKIGEDIKAGIAIAVDSLEGMKRSLDDWSGVTQREAKKVSQAYGDVEDVQTEMAKTARKAELEMSGSAMEMARNVGGSANKVVEALEEVKLSKVEMYLAAKEAVIQTSLAYGELEDAVGLATGGVIRSIDELAREQADAARETERILQAELDARQDIANKMSSLLSRQLSDQRTANETLRDYWRETSQAYQKETQAQADTAARETQRISDSWTGFRNDQDTTMQALEDSGIGFEQAVKLLAQRHGISVMQMTDDLAAGEVKYRDTFALMEFAGRESINGIIGDYKRLETEKASLDAALLLGQQERERRVAAQAEVFTAERPELNVGQMNRLINVGGLGAGKDTSFGTGRSTIAGAFAAIQGHRGGMMQGGLSDEALLGEILKAAPDAAWGNLPEGLQEIRDRVIAGVNGKAGGGWAGGRTLVGERGPEIVNLPTGSYVNPHGSGSMGGGSNTFHFHGAVYGLEDLRRVVVEAVRDHAISGGFRGVFGEA